MDETLTQIIARMPGWGTETALAIVPLSGGISNQNYRVTVRGESFVVRVCGKDTELLGVDRANEHACNVIAAETGIAPEVIAFFPDLGSIVTRFVEGTKIPAEIITRPENLARVAQSIRRLHAARPLPSMFSPFRAAESYYHTARRLGAQLPANAEDLMSQLGTIESAMYGALKEPPMLRPCHNDLLNENFLDDGTVRIIDYEYAGMGDPFFDLGNFAAHHELSAEQVYRLACAYFALANEPTLEQSAIDAACARIHLMMIVSDLREALWGAVQTRLSTLDFDYQAYAGKHFERCASAWVDPRVPDWLEQARRTATRQ